MRVPWNAVLSTLVAAAWLAATGGFGSGAGFLQGTARLAVPLVCIWWPEQMGSIASGRMRASPGCLVRAFGWIALIILTFGQILIVALV